MKILIVSHPPMTTQNNMGKTFMSLFSHFEKEELCQLYIYPSYPDADLCKSYYRVTDKEALGSWMLRRNIGAEIPHERIHQGQGQYEVEADRAFYKSRKNKSAFRRLMRDAMWKFAPWYNGNLKKWLDKEKPDCIFVAPGVAKFLYDIALKISAERNIPIVSYICDEYYFVKEPGDLPDKLRLGLLRRKIEKLMGRSSHLVVISEELKDAYCQKFGIESTVLMTGSSASGQKREEKLQPPKQICYFGNIRCNRYITLGEIGREIEAINREKGTDYKLKIYTAEKDPEILGHLEAITSVELCGFVSGAAYERAFADAQLLLHTEAFDEASVDFTQHSISTKIADSLASGIPLVAYGPDSISSMQHLIRHDCALTATSRAELCATLLAAFEQESAREAVVSRAVAVAQSLHDEKRNSQQLRQLLADVAAQGQTQ